MVDHGSRRAGAAVAGRIAREDPRDLQAPVPEGHRPVPRRARRPRVLAARRGAQPRDRGARRHAGPAGVLCYGSLPHSHTEGGRAMNAMTARGLSLAAVVAVWTAISHFGKLPLQLWPVIVGIGCFVAAGGGIPGLQKAVAGTVSGVIWALLYVTVAGALGRQELVSALVLGAAMFGIVYQARVPLLSYTAGALAGAGVAFGVLGMRIVTMQGGLRVAIALSLGAILGYAAEWLEGRIRSRVV